MRWPRPSGRWAISRAPKRLFTEALALGESLKDDNVQATAWHGLGRVHSSQGDWKRARGDWQRALPLRRSAGDRRGEAATPNNLGLAAVGLGEFQAAFAFYRASLAIRRETGDRRGEGDTLNAMGLTFWILGETEQAIDHFEQALTFRRETADVRGEAITLHNAGLALIHADRHTEAIDYLQRALAKKRAIGDRAEEASTLRYLGVASQALGRNDAALAYFEQSNALWATRGSPPEFELNRQNMAGIYLARGEPARAREILREVRDRFGDSWTGVHIASIITDLARAERELGRLDEAEKLAAEAIDITERARRQILAPDIRASFTALGHRPYGLMIDILMRRDTASPAAGHAARAFTVSEQVRARSLIEMLTEARADIRQDADPALLEEERKLLDSINDTAARLSEQLARAPNAPETMALRRQFDERSIEQRDLQARIRTASPQFAMLAMPPPMTLDAVRRDLLDDRSVLLEYALGDDRSYLWAVTTSGMTTHVLPARRIIESVAREYYERITAADQTAARVAVKRASDRLADMILAPARETLGDRRLLIVADGLLQYVPFAALPNPRAPQDPLIVSREVLMLPSASALAALRANTDRQRVTDREVAVFADPVLAANDARVGRQVPRTGVNADGAESDLLRSARDTGGVTLSRLPYTQAEADAIASLAGAGQALKAVGFRANRALALSADLARYRVLHFATHALVNDRRPPLSGIVLSLVDEKGQPQDGFLRLQDIYTLRLGADLVVLSACRTALGRNVRGEGLIGLTRGFMHAGVPRVMATLWDVRDRATAELMTRFYRALLRDKRSPGAALRAAQLQMLRDPRWSATASWAGFVLQGDWR